MNTDPRRPAIHCCWLLLLALCAALGACAWLDEKQRQTALRPTPTQPAEVAAVRPGDERWTVPVAAAQGDEQRLALWWLPQADPQAPALLYLHGTFRNLYRNQPKINALRDAGFAVLAVDYRGWGDSTPIVPSEETINADARVAWAEMLRRQPLASTAPNMVPTHHSLSCITWLGLRRKPPGSTAPNLVPEPKIALPPDHS